MHLPLVNKTGKVNMETVDEGTDKVARTRVKRIVINYVLVLVCGIVFFKILFGTCWVKGRSMYPTYRDGDFVFINRVDRDFSRGDVIIAQVHVRGEENARMFFKRIIAIAGDTIEVDEENQQVILNGEALYEPYVNPGYFTNGDMNGQMMVPDGYVFVMGDNRPESRDSRSSTVGLILEENICGTVLFRILHSPLR